MIYTPLGTVPFPTPNGEAVFCIFPEGDSYLTLPQSTGLRSDSYRDVNNEIVPPPDKIILSAKVEVGLKIMALSNRMLADQFRDFLLG